MLAKLWKKVALAICIIAILVNITNKLVHKTNVKDELQSVLGTEALSLFGEEEEDSESDAQEENEKSIQIEE